VLRHTTIERAVMVDIDAELVDLCRQHLPSMHRGAFDDARAEVRCEDAYAYLEASREQFDAVILDLTAPLKPGPSRALYGLDFYRTARSRLAPGGVLALQAQSASPNNLEWHRRILETLRSLFAVVRPCGVYVPFFAEPWSFAVASDTLDPLGLPMGEVDARLRERVEGPLASYDGASHHALFALLASRSYATE
jgi:spermidine synthase